MDINFLYKIPKTIFFKEQIKIQLTHRRTVVLYRETIFTSINATGKTVTRVEKVNTKEVVPKFIKYLKEHDRGRNR